MALHSEPLMEHLTEVYLVHQMVYYWAPIMALYLDLMMAQHLVLMIVIYLAVTTVRCLVWQMDLYLVPMMEYLMVENLVQIHQWLKVESRQC